MNPKLKKVLVKNINLGGLAKDSIDEILEPALLEVVNDTANPFDNMMMDSMYQRLEDALKEKIDAYYAKLLGSI